MSQPSIISPPVTPPFFFMVFLLWLALIGCSPPALPPLDNDSTILAFGDSLTAGVGAAESSSYPVVLETLSGIPVINAGVSGETTGQGLKRLPTALDQHDPDLLILIEGGNDILRNQNPKQIEENLDKMIEIAQSRLIPVVLLGIPEKRLFSDSAPFYQTLAEKHQLIFDGKLIADLQRNPALKSDYIHFNSAGYRKMAESIYRLLKENGAL